MKSLKHSTISKLGGNIVSNLNDSHMEKIKISLKNIIDKYTNELIKVVAVHLDIFYKIGEKLQGPDLKIKSALREMDFFDKKNDFAK